MAAPPPFCGTAAPQILRKKSLRKHGFTVQSHGGILSFGELTLNKDAEFPQLSPQLCHRN